MREQMKQLASEVQSKSLSGQLSAAAAGRWKGKVAVQWQKYLPRHMFRLLRRRQGKAFREVMAKKGFTTRAASPKGPS
eukprot:s1102_g8.t1